MAWFPISHTVLQYANSSSVNYSGAVLKPYASGTSTPINFAIDSAGATTIGSCALNASGYPVSSGNIVILYVEEKFKLALYPTQAAADANSGAIWTVDGLPITGDFGATTQAISTSTVLNSSDNLNHFEATGTITVTLPDIDTVGSGFVFTIRNAGTGVITLDGDGAETINSTATISLYPGDGALVQSGSTNWSAIISSRAAQNVNAQTGTTYTFLSTDDRKLVTFSNTSSIAVTLPQANSTTFQDGWSVTVTNKNTGLVTITPTTSTINGAATYTLNYGESVKITSDGTNYQISGKAASGLVLLQTQTAAASASITFSATYITTTYKEYVIKLLDIVDDQVLNLTVSTNDGSSYLGTAEYYYNTQERLSDSATIISRDSTAGVAVFPVTSVYTPGTATGYNASGYIRLYDPTNTSLYKGVVTSLIISATAQTQFLDGGCMIATTAAVNNIKLAPAANTINSGIFKLYGVL